MNILPYLEIELLRNNYFMKSGLYNTQNGGKNLLKMICIGLKFPNMHRVCFEHSM